MALNNINTNTSILIKASTNRHYCRT